MIGEKTAGAVVGGRIFLLSNGDALYCAVTETKVDGARLEGVGVQPDYEVIRKHNQGLGRQPVQSCLGNHCWSETRRLMAIAINRSQQSFPGRHRMNFRSRHLLRQYPGGRSQAMSQSSLANCNILVVLFSFVISSLVNLDACALPTKDGDTSVKATRIHNVDDEFPQKYRNAFDRYIQVIAPNGKPIHIFAQPAITDAQLRHVRGRNASLLNQPPGLRIWCG